MCRFPAWLVAEERDLEHFYPYLDTIRMMLIFYNHHMRHDVDDLETDDHLHARWEFYKMVGESFMQRATAIPDISPK